VQRQFSRLDATNQPDGQISKKLSSPARENNPLNPSGKSALSICPILSHSEGRIAIVTVVGMGCGGRSSVGRAGNRRAGFPWAIERRADERRLNASA